MTTPDLDDLLTAAAPRIELAELDARLDALWRATVAAERAASPWRRRLVALTAVTAAAGIGLAGAAAANGGLPLLSGFFDHGTESVADEEYLNVGSPEFRSVFDRESRRHDLPSGASYEVVYRNLTKTGGLMQVSGLRGQLALFAGCRWERTWVASPAQRPKAARALASIADDPALARVDGGGIVSQLRAVADAAATGDAPTVEAAAEACS